jgi:DNA replication protein DnaC
MSEHESIHIPDPERYEPFGGTYRMRVPAIKALCLTEAGFPPRVLTDTPIEGDHWKAVFYHLAALLNKGLLAALIGARGAGKTRMAVELVRRKVDLANANVGPEDNTRKPTSSLYIRAMTMFLQMREAMRGGGDTTESGYVAQLCKPRLLFIDEVQERGDSAWEDRLLRHIIDQRYGEQRDTVLIGNQSAKDFAETFGPSVADRMREAGGIIECKWPSFRGNAK